MANLNGRVIIIGAGIGGICTAIRLLLEGYEVEIYEKNSFPGGCIHYLKSSDGCYKIDTSASLAINPVTYDEIFIAAGRNPEVYYKKIRMENNYRVYTYDNKEFDLNINLKKTQENLRKYFEEDIKGYGDFVLTTAKRYNDAKNEILNRAFIKQEDVYNIRTAKELYNLHTLSSSGSYVKQFIKDKELREIILFQTFFMGRSPYEMPAIYSSIAANTQIEGLIHIEGGLSSYISALMKLFNELGGKIYFDSRAQEIVYDDDTAKSIVVNGSEIRGDYIVVNTDYIYSQTNLLKRKMERKYKLSCSTFVIHLGLSKIYEDLFVHNIYLNRNFKKEVNNVFKGKLPKTPTLYIYYPSVVDKNFCKNEGESVMNIMVRVPNTYDMNINWDAKLDKSLYNIVINEVKKIPGFNDIEENIKFKSYTNPNDFKQTYGYTDGCCFGIGHTFFQSMMFRPQVRDKKLKNLFYVGSSIHPGNGASIVMDCAKITAEEIMKAEKS